MKTIAFIPARCGSKSIFLKNVQDFCGKPLIYWNLAALNQTKEIDIIYVATDCQEIKEIITNFKMNKVKVYDRDPENAQDSSSTEQVMIEFIEKQELDDQDIFLLVQATSPLTESSDFSNALKLFEDEKIDSILTCARLKKFFWKDNGIAINYNYKNRPRRQDFDGTLWETGAFYINTVANIRKHKNRISGKIAIYEMAEYKGVDLDEPDDWIWAENLMRKYSLSKTKPKNKIKLFATDVDGVLTDAGMYYSESGDELKKFNTRDGKGIELLRNAGIYIAILTSENTNIVTKRGEKLKCDYIFQGLSNKLDVLTKLCRDLNISLDEVAYIGDDLNDIDILKAVGYSATPADGMRANQGVVDYICKLRGGEGCVREFIDNIIIPDLI